MERPQSYDLRQERWIGFVRQDGTFGKEGLHYLLNNAQDIRDIVDQSPLVKFSIYRLLIAIVHWLRPMKDLDDWVRTWDERRFPEHMRDELMSRGEDCFDLFSKQHPFFQDNNANRPKELPTISNLAADVPSGSTINHFRHAYDDEQAFCPACCAKGLIQLPAFCIGTGAGKSKKRDQEGGKPGCINAIPPLYLLPTGESLFQTIMLNLPVSGLVGCLDRLIIPGDVPAWVDEPGKIGLCEGLTWQPRRARLITDIDLLSHGSCTRCGENTAHGGVEILIRRALFGAGRPSPHGGWIDPHVSYGTNGKASVPKPEKPQKPQKSGKSDHPLWCVVADVLNNMGNPDGTQIPLMFRQLAEIRRRRPGAISGACNIAWYWAKAKQGKYQDWGSGQWPVCYQLIDNPDLAETLRKALQTIYDNKRGVARQLAFREKPMKQEEADERVYRLTGNIAHPGVMDLDLSANMAFLELLASLQRDPSSARAEVDRFKQLVQNSVREWFGECASLTVGLAGRLGPFIAMERYDGALSNSRKKGKNQ